MLLIIFIRLSIASNAWLPSLNRDGKMPVLDLKACKQITEKIFLIIIQHMHFHKTDEKKASETKRGLIIKNEDADMYTLLNYPRNEKVTHKNTWEIQERFSGQVNHEVNSKSKQNALIKLLESEQSKPRTCPTGGGSCPTEGQQPEAAIYAKVTSHFRRAFAPNIRAFIIPGNLKNAEFI